MDNGVVLDLFDMTKKLFSSPVQEPNSFAFQIIVPDNILDKEKFCFDQLLLIFTEGMKHFYGDELGEVDLAKLSENDFYNINNYFKSIGYEVHYQFKPLSDISLPMFPEKTFNDYFKLTTDHGFYYITFSFYQHPRSYKNTP